MSINKKNITTLYIIFGVSTGIMSALSGALYWEYTTLKEHIVTMLQLQKTYKKQLAHVKKYANQIQKPIEKSVIQSTEGTTILVNRDPVYLQKQFKAFAQEKKLLKPGQTLADIYDHADFYFIADEKERRRQMRARQLQENKSVKKIAKFAQNAQKGLPLLWPVDLSLFWISSLFGPRKKPNGRPGFHHGIDLAAAKGTPVKAAYAGRVMQAQYVPGYGNTIIVVHNKTYRTRYAHLDQIMVKKGQRVIAGQIIGTVGATGYVRKNGTDPSHLHFEVHKHGKHVNPIHYLFH